MPDPQFPVSKSYGASLEPCVRASASSSFSKGASKVCWFSRLFIARGADPPPLPKVAELWYLCFQMEKGTVLAAIYHYSTSLGASQKQCHGLLGPKLEDCP